MSQHILVTGAGGFLGSHICKYFGDMGHSIAAVGRFRAAPEVVSQYPNLWKFAGMTLPDEAFIKVIREFSPVVLIHCAGTASVPDSVRDPFDDFKRNVEVCAFTLDTIRKEAKNCVYVFCSSAAVYGNPKTLPINESAIVNPISPYGYHKRMCEILVEEYACLHNLQTIVLRIFSAYGERLQKQIVFDLCNKFMDPATNTVQLFGSGNETRDFIHAYDVAKAIQYLVDQRSTGIYNIASGVQTTISTLALMIGSKLNSLKPILFKNVVRSGDPQFWHADISKLHQTGYNQSVDLETGIQRTCKWYIG